MTCLAAAVLLKPGRVQLHRERFQSREKWHSHCIKWALYYISADRKQLATLTGSSVFCIGRNLSCSSEKELEILILQPGTFFHMLETETAPSQARTIRRHKHSSSSGKNLPCPGHNPWFLMGSCGWYIYSQWTWGIQWNWAHLSQERMEAVFLFKTPRWFLSKYLECSTTLSNVEKSCF